MYEVWNIIQTIIIETTKFSKINKQQRAYPCKPTAISASFQLIFVGPVRVVLV